MPKRATCSDECAALRHGVSRREPKAPKERKPTRPPRLCRCGAAALPKRATCSDACALAAAAKPGRGDSVRARRRRQRRTAYRRPDKESVSARLLAEQKGKCLVCGREGGLVLDHCHTTGEPRAMLCTRCNAALGLMLEDPAAIGALKAYAEACALLR